MISVWTIEVLHLKHSITISLKKREIALVCRDHKNFGFGNYVFDELWGESNKSNPNDPINYQLSTKTSD